MVVVQAGYLVRALEEPQDLVVEQITEDGPADEGQHRDDESPSELGEMLEQGHRIG
jgi:hypothetical protein